MKVWTTKYLLSEGVRCVEVRESHAPTMVIDVKTGECFHGEGRHWHRTEEAAVKMAEDTRRKTIAALKRRIKRLEALSFVSNG